MNIFLSPLTPENLVSRDGFGSPVPRQPARLYTQAESGAYLRGFLSSSAAVSIYLFKPPHAIRSVSSLSGHALAYRWRSQLRVRRHRASKPQDSSKQGLPWQVTMDQLICASRSHTHYWYEVGILKVLHNSVKVMMSHVFVSLISLDYSTVSVCARCRDCPHSGFTTKTSRSDNGPRYSGLRDGRPGGSVGNLETL